MSPVVRNVAIVLALAALVAFLPGGDDTATFIASVLSIAILASIVMILGRLYREHRMTLFSLGDRHRGFLYGALGAIVVAMAGRERLFDTGPGVFVWFVLMGAAAYAIFLVWRHHREYGI